MDKEDKKTSAVIPLIVAFCWVIAIFSVYITFNEYKSYKKLESAATLSIKQRQMSFENTNTREVTTNVALVQEIESGELDGAEQSTTASVSAQSVEAPVVIATAKTYVINKNSKKIHSPSCQYANSMKEDNKLVVEIDNLEEYINNGYTICSKCGAK